MFGPEKCEGSQVSLLEHFLQITQQHLPFVDRVIGEYGDLTLSSYLKNFIQEPKPSLQRKDDLFEVLERMAEPLLGETVANQAVLDLEAFPVMLTANHNGVDSISQSFQASLIFSLNAIQGAQIVACGQDDIQAGMRHTVI